MEMRTSSTFLNSLNRDTESLTRVQYASIWTPLDLMIVPASSSQMPVGNEQRFCGSSTSPYDFADRLFEKNRGLPFNH